MSSVSGVSSVGSGDQVVSQDSTSMMVNPNSTTVGGTIGELPPEVTHAIMQGIAMQICTQMQRSAERMKRILREADRKK